MIPHRKNLYKKSVVLHLKLGVTYKIKQLFNVSIIGLWGYQFYILGKQYSFQTVCVLILGCPSWIRYPKLRDVFALIS